MQLDTAANDSSYLLDFDNPQIDTIFSKYKIYQFSQAFPTSRKEENQKYFIVACDSSQLILDTYLYLSEYFISAEAFVPNLFYCYSSSDYVSYPGTNYTFYLDLINAKDAWDITKGDPDIKIGIADSYCLTNHEDLDGKVTVVGGLGSFDYHGTMVAGCAAANTDNGTTGTASIGFNSSILFKEGGGINNLLLLAQSGAKVLNASWVTACNTPIPAEQAIINEIYDMGVVVVAAAGNGSFTPSESCNNGLYNNPALATEFNGYAYPASYDHVISVTSVGSLLPYGTNDVDGAKRNWHDVHFVVADDPNQKSHAHNDKVDICAPGYSNYTTAASGTSAYAGACGTSFASPVVAGACALLFSINPCFTPDDIENILKTTAYNIYQVSENSQFSTNQKLGAGRLDAAAACSLATVLCADHVISNGQNITWSTSKIVAHKLTIESGGTLTITGTAYMGKDARIIIQRGGKLVLDGATLTTNCTDAMWAGIEIWGDPTVDQRTTASHGWLEIKNGSLIENAKDAIYTGRVDGNNDWVWSHTGGGIVQAFNSTFRNNGRSVQIMSFHNPKSSGVEPANINVFKNCVFETTRRLREDLYIKNGVYCAPTYFVTVWDVKSMRFYGNTFRNTGLSNFPYELGVEERKGSGILFYGASCIFDDYIPCVNCSPVHNLFSNLYHGLDNKSTNSVTSMNIRNCIFTNVEFGISLDGVRGDKIIGNIFDTENPLDPYVSLMAQLQAKNSSGFLVTENNFKKSYGSIQNSYGLYIDQTTVTGAEVYKNTLRDHKWGLETNNDNQNLAVRCNDFDNLWRDWNSNRIGENEARPSQIITDGNYWYSPTNLFDNNCVSANYEHIYNTNPTITLQSKHNLFYYYGNESRPPVTSCVSFLTISLLPYGGNRTLNCNSKTTTNNGAIQTDIINKKTAATSKKALIDGGRTNDLLTIVNNPLAGEAAVHDSLMLYSPFLSDEVLIACINRSTFHDSYLFDILLLHSGLSAPVQEALDNRSPAMLQGLYDSLMIWHDSIPARDTLEALIHSFLLDAQLGLNELLRNYEDSGLVDSILYQLSLQDDVNSKGRYINMLIEQGDLSTAATLIVNLDGNDPEQADLQTFENIHRILKNGGDNWFSATENDKEDLRELATHETLTARHALAVLMLIEDTLVYLTPDTATQVPNGPAAQPLSNHKTSVMTTQLLVYPNPFTYTATVEYRLPPQNMGKVSLKVYSVQGRLLKEMSLGLAKSGKVTVSLDEAASGMYIIQLVQNGVIVKTQKLVKQP